MNKQAPVTTAAPLTATQVGLKIAPATSGQQRLWYQCELLKPAYTYNEQLEVMVFGKLDITVLKKIIETLVQRHEGLRTVFRLSKKMNFSRSLYQPFRCRCRSLLSATQRLTNNAYNNLSTITAYSRVRRFMTLPWVLYSVFAYFSYPPIGSYFCFHFTISLWMVERPLSC